VKKCLSRWLIEILSSHLEIVMCTAYLKLVAFSQLSHVAAHEDPYLLQGICLSRAQPAVLFCSDHACQLRLLEFEALE